MRRRGLLIVRGALAASLALGSAAVPFLASPAEADVVHHPVVPPDVGPGRALVLRPHRVDVINHHHYVRSIFLDGSAATLSGLAAAVADPAYAAVRGDTLILRATVLERPGTSLTVGGANLRRVELAGDPRSPVWFHGRNARITVHDVSLVTQRTARSTGIDFVGSSAVTLRSARVSLNQPRIPPAPVITVGGGSRLTAYRTTLVGGVRAVGTSSVSLIAVRVLSAKGPGVLLRDAGMVTFTDLAVERSNGDGIVITGARTHVVSAGGLVLRRNARAGLAVTAGAAIGLRDVRSEANGSSGISLSRSGSLAVSELISAYESEAIHVATAGRLSASGVTAAGDRVGVTVAPDAGAVSLHGIAITGARTGVRVDGGPVQADGVTVLGSALGLQVGPGARAVRVAGLSVTGSGRSQAGSAGAVLAGDDTVLSGVHIAGVRNGIRVAGRSVVVHGGTVAATGIGVSVAAGATEDRLVAVQIAAGETGIVSLPGSTLFSGSRLTVTGGRRAGVRAAGASTVLDSTTIDVAGTAVTAYGPTRVTRSTLRAEVGVHVGRGVTARFENDRVHGQRYGVYVAPRAKVRIVASKVYGFVPIHGKASVRGESFIAPLPLHWLGICGVSLIGLAIVLIVVTRIREHRHDRLVRAPEHVLNRA